MRPFNPIRERRELLGRVRSLEGDVRRLRRALEKAKGASKHAVLDYPGAEITIDVSSDAARRRKDAVAKEPFTAAWIDTLPSGDVLYDIGANVGAYALIAAKRPHGALQVVAFEPGYANFATLCTNVVLNEAGDDIVPLPVTLGEETHLGTFEYSDLRAGSSKHAGDIEPMKPSVYSQPALVFRLDDIVERFALPAPQHIKLDVDGAELFVLRGAGALLASPALRSVMIELSSREDDEVDTMLRESGLRRVDEFRRRPDATFWYAHYEREAEA